MSPRGRRRSRPDFSHRIEYVLLRIGAAFLALLPSFAHAPVARFLGGVWFYLFPMRKGVVLENLTRAFPNRSPHWRRRTARRCFEHFARMMGFEFPAMLRFTPDDFRTWLPRIDGREYYDALHLSGKPWIFVSGHLGNWELGVARFAAIEKNQTTVLAKPLHNPLVENLVARVRAARGYEVVHTRGNMRPVVAAVNQGRTLAFLTDQDARRNGILVPFFGVPASTAQGPAFFAHRFNLPILVGVCVREENKDVYRMRFYPPIIPNPDADRDAEIQRMTREHVALLESAIRETPEQYFWFHRRWKTQVQEMQT